MPWGFIDPYDVDVVQTGKGLRIAFHEKVGDIFVQGLYAAEFFYRVNIINEQTGNIISSSDWHSTIESYSLREILLNPETEPALLPNEPNELTQIEAYMVTRQDEVEQFPQNRSFRVVDGFQPEALFF